MTDHNIKNNQVTVVGKVIEEIQFSHKVYGEGFYTFKVEVPRLSNVSDILPVTISERLLAGKTQLLNAIVEIQGQFRSYNQYEQGKNRLILTIFALDLFIKENEEELKSINQIYLDGYICKAPVYRTTPFGREITDILIAVNRSYHKSDYIPCIAWGRNAKYAQHLKVGDHLKIWGRVQSRDYQKKLENGEVTTKTAYEVSISKMEIDDDNNKE
ncbi:MAG TPA: single-stranded DNA-binding protein [Defluviitaleaceae bacterium]|nr:single-stranded DNA-binding protein [Candidatus Epulonipiscium sp.]HPT76345.1 single-stranded DNA-binding protein [Defluviitaleaceae bacterium]HQD51432.1 single-stranded DNA-binding protein [Defluviitaleaceae bacterium]